LSGGILKHYHLLEKVNLALVEQQQRAS